MSSAAGFAVLRYLQKTTSKNVTGTLLEKIDIFKDDSQLDVSFVMYIFHNSDS